MELIGDDAEERGRFDAVLRTIRMWVADEFDAANQAAALFLSERGELVKAVQLPAPVDNLFALGSGPAVAPLARMVEDHDHHCVVVVDNARARILSVYLNSVESEESYSEPAIPRRTHGGGWSQARFQRHRAEQVQQFHAEVADHLDRFVRRHGSDGIILLGTSKRLPTSRRRCRKRSATGSLAGPASAPKPPWPR